MKNSGTFNHFLVWSNMVYMIFFGNYHIDLMVAASAVFLALGLYSYVLIKKNDLFAWTRIIYISCIGMMAAGTVALGFGYGFNLYSISNISLSFYISYLGKHYGHKRRSPLLIPLLTMTLYFICYIFVRKWGALYEINDNVQMFFFIINSVEVFAVLITYMFIFISSIEETEKKLEEMAHVDNLTGLYNRHYMLSYINDRLSDKLSESRIAILDIDNFKHINDTYGHNCGDEVLRSIAHTLEHFSDRCTVCRWGGEEFIILSSSGDGTLLEELRKKIADTAVEYEGTTVNVTVTIGAENYSGGYNVDKWISEADRKLYEGKNSGKNKVVL